MNLTRRTVLASAAAVPVAAAMSSVCWASVSHALFCYDPHLAPGTQLAAAAREEGMRAVALEGDRIRQAQALLASRPAVVRGVSRQADALLFEEVAREAGYVLAESRVEGSTITWTLALRG